METTPATQETPMSTAYTAPTPESIARARQLEREYRRRLGPGPQAQLAERKRLGYAKHDALRAQAGR
jgi:hypothetical protein